MNKRGLSAVVITLIIILLVLVAIGIIWVVVRNILSEGSEEVSLGKFMIDLNIEKAYIEGENIKVRTKRNVGRADLIGINFIFSDGTNTKIIKKETNLQELGRYTFIFSQEELEDIGFVKEVSIAPILKLESGKETRGNIVDTKKISIKEFLVNLGAVSWWKLDNNSNDEIGKNSGTVYGPINYSSGKFDDALELTGGLHNLGIELMNSDVAENYENTFSYSLWFKSSTISGDSAARILSRNCDYYYCLRINQGTSDQDLRHHCSPGKISPWESLENPTDWHHVAAVWDYSNTNFTWYLDGGLIYSDPSLTSFEESIMPLVIGGDPVEGGGIAGNNFVGLIDEVIFFNRALSEEEVKQLYNFG